jgi:hypothetical protein
MDDPLDLLLEHNLYDNEENHLVELQKWIVDEITRLRAEVHTVLSREAATIARHDTKFDALEAESNRMRDALEEIAEMNIGNIRDDPHDVRDIARKGLGIKP